MAASKEDNPYAQWHLGDYGIQHAANPIEQSVGPSRIVRGNPYEGWMQRQDTSPGFYQPPTEVLGELALLPLAIPAAVYGYGAVVAVSGFLGAALMANDEELKNKAAFTNMMRYLFANLKILDAASWENNRCKWHTTNKVQRQRWKAFMVRFGKFYRDVGTPQLFVSDGEVAALRSFLRQYKGWTGFFEGPSCRIAPAPTSVPDPDLSPAQAAASTCSTIDKLTGNCPGQPKSALSQVTGALPWLIGGAGLLIGYRIYKDVKSG